MRVLFAISDTSFPDFGYKKTAVKCSIYNSPVSCLFSCFWIKLSMCYCSKSANRGQGLAEKKRKESQRGLGILPYGNFIIRTVGKYGNFAYVCPDIGSACYSTHDTPEGCVDILKNRNNCKGRNLYYQKMKIFYKTFENICFTMVLARRKCK